MTIMNVPYCEALQGQKGFCNKVMCPPPSETCSRVIQFELTEGCSHNRCTFCNMYKGSGYSVKSLDDFKQHVDKVLDYLPHDTDISRIFIGSGNALSVDTDKLTQATQYALRALKNKIREVPRRLSIYGNTMDILKHGFEGIRQLNCGGTCHGICSSDYFGTRRGVDVIYWGLESGSTKILKISGKGYDKAQVMKAGSILNNSKAMRASIMIMPGLGGLSYFDQHVSDTVEALNECKPKWITFMGLKIIEGTPYSGWIKKQEKSNKNRSLTPNEIVEQTAQIIERLRFETIIGIHGKDIHQDHCYNPVPVGSEEVSDQFDRKNMANFLRRQSSKQ